MNLFMEPEYKKMLDEDSKPGYGLKGSPKVKEEEDAPKKSVTNNNLFVGSTKDLLRALKDEQVIEHE